MGATTGMTMRPWDRVLNRYMGSTVGPGDPVGSDPRASAPLFRVWSCPGDVGAQDVSDYMGDGSSYLYNAGGANFGDWKHRGLMKRTYGRIPHPDRVVLEIELAGWRFCMGMAQRPWHGQNQMANVLYVDQHVASIRLAPDYSLGVGDRGQKGAHYQFEPEK